MKITKSFLLLAAVFLAFGALTAPRARADVSVSFFYDTLDPYGEWVDVPDYGYCWHPTAVDDNWAPYTDGYWAYTDAGWTWVSYEDYGGVVYHYGRWMRIPEEGWVWVPGNTWAPAWVSWRTNDDYVGWAPLPPEARWSADIGFSTWVDARFDIGPGCYSFVGVRDFGAPALGPVIVNREQNVTIINRTTNITNITVNNSTVYTGGPSYAKIAARSARPIPTLKLVRQGDAGAIRAAGGKILSHQQGNRLVVLAPKVTPVAGGTRPAPTKIAKTLTGAKPDHGWSAVKDPQERAKLQAQIKDQSGSENTHAKPVSASDVKLVDQKIKSQPAPKESAAGGTAPGVAGTEKGKGGKKKGEDLTTLENAPATEPGTAAGEATPKPSKGKKSKAVSESNPTETAGVEATPAPKSKKSRKPAAFEENAEGTPIPKSKKSKTPSLEENGYSDTSTPKHSKKSSDSNLQPFMSGGGNEEKPKKEKPTEAPANPEKSFEGRGPAPGYAGEVKPPKGQGEQKGDKGNKGDKKNKNEENVPPNQ